MRKSNIFALLRTFMFAALLPAMLLGLVSCEPENGNDGGDTVTPEVFVPDGYVNYFIEDLSFSRSAGEVKVVFQINVGWSMGVVAPEGTSSSWCSVSPSSGDAGLHEVVVCVTDNDFYESRSAKIHVLCDSVKVTEITVTQDYEYAVLLSRRDYSVSHEATTIDVELKSNVDFEYEIADSVDWVRVSADATRGLDAHNLVFEVGENDSRKERVAHILFYNSEYAVADTLTLVQESNPDYVAVDLGLSVKWASYNVGAESPEEYGNYYAWGETEEKDNYSWPTYKWCNGSINSLTKYCTDSSYGAVDNKTLLDPEDDVACVLWGEGWRMPTLDEVQELCNNCSWEWTSVNGVNGQKVTGSNGNSIFLPAAGRCFDTIVFDRGSYGNYWSGTSCWRYNDCYSAYSLNFNSGMWDWNGTYYWRLNGLTIRPVTK